MSALDEKPTAASAILILKSVGFASTVMDEYTGEATDITDEVQDLVLLLAELIEAVRPRVALTFEQARAADDRGESLIWCQGDVLNPCWLPDMPVTAPLRHWGYTPDMDGDKGDALACADCRLRAALARIGGAA